MGRRVGLGSLRSGRWAARDGWLQARVLLVLLRRPHAATWSVGQQPSVGNAEPRCSGVGTPAAQQRL